MTLSLSGIVISCQTRQPRRSRRIQQVGGSKVIQRRFKRDVKKKKKQICFVYLLLHSLYYCFSGFLWFRHFFRVLPFFLIFAMGMCKHRTQVKKCINKQQQVQNPLKSVKNTKSCCFLLTTFPSSICCVLLCASVGQVQFCCSGNAVVVCSLWL